TGHAINEVGQFVPVSWTEIIFNPSFPYRLVHTVIGAYLTTALVVGGVGAWHMLRHRRDVARAPRGPEGDAALPPSVVAARTMFSMAMWMAALVAPLQIVVGDLHGLNTLEHQPAKVMAMEGHYDSHPDGAPLVLFGIPNTQTRSIDHAIQIPKLSSLILKHDLDAPLDGLDTIPEHLHPPVPVVFWSFRIMVAMGMAMLLLG